MAGSSFGNIFKITTWGESHGKALGVVIDGVPAGLKLSEEDIQPFMDRRAPGKSSISTPRKEADEVEILSGIFEGKTTGTPISVMVRNTSQISADYSEIAAFYRPGHADLTYDMKYGFRDYRGGGRSSGRETLGRVAAGAVAVKLLRSLDVEIYAYTKAIGPVSIDESRFDKSLITSLPTCMPDAVADEKAMEYLQGIRADENSAGGIIECVIKSFPPGIGDPVFEKLSANLSKAVMSIGAVKAVELGDGTRVSDLSGYENNDAYYMEGGAVCKATNHSGGILGGISDGSDIILRAYIKPTPSIHKSQSTVNKSGENINVNIHGRHDPVIVPRAVVVVESMCAIAALDALMTNMSARLSYITDFYNNNSKD